MAVIRWLPIWVLAGMPAAAAEPAAKAVDFERHVMGLLSKAGCNSGSCHGSFQGRNGFRLSLFGFDPDRDFNALTRDNLGRRVNLANPHDSLILQKATGRVAHDGGVRFGRDSWQYQTLRTWIADGAKWSAGSGKIEALTLTPGDFLKLTPGQTANVAVTATFADGSNEDVTTYCDFKITDDAVATVSPLGVVTANKPGDAGLTVLYRGAVRGIRVLVPAPTKEGVNYAAVPEVNYVDREVFAKLKLLNMVPSDVCADLEFLRRVTIDTIGLLPTPDEARAFAASTDPEKRAKKVDELLAHPLHAALWATKMSDVTGNNTDGLENPNPLKFKRSQQWHDWLRARFAANVPYDAIVRDILTATSRDGLSPEEFVGRVKKFDAELDAGAKTSYAEKPTLDLFWRRQQQVPVEQWGEKVAAAFLGVRLECAQCHKHPTDRWTQEEYWGFANLFSQVVFPGPNQFSSPEVKKLVDAENEARKQKSNTPANNNNLNVVREMFLAPRVNLRPIPGSNRVIQPKALGGPEMKLSPGEDVRVKLAGWLTSPENPYFARSFANRVWAHYFGIGVVHPVDDFSQANPPTNPRLLIALADDFAKSGFDVRKLERTILLSRTYQLSAMPNDTNRFDKNNFAHSYVRPLMAEQVVDVLNSALGVEELFPAAQQPAAQQRGQPAAKTATAFPHGTKMTEVGATLVGGNTGLNAGNLGYILRIFGRPPRTTACDCERAAEPALPQTLFKMTDPALMGKINAADGRAMTVAKKKLTDDEVIEELFLATLTRIPTAKEKSDSLDHLKGAKNRTVAIQELTWALINTREFILNH
jgi:hypothetical protein